MSYARIAATLAVAVAVPAVVSTTAEAQAPDKQAPQAKQPLRLHGTCITAKKVRKKVIRKHGRRAPGRDICRWGVVKAHHETRPSTHRERVAYLAQLRALIRPRPYLRTTGAQPPAQPPAGTLTPTAAPAGVASCIVARESGGNPQAVNGQYHGIAQWSPEAWARMGGHQYAADPLGASYQQQLSVLSSGLTKYGSGDWSPYDGC